MEEVWRDIATSPNYEVSTLGNVRHKTRLHILKPIAERRGDNYTCYSYKISNINGKFRRQYIHRLVGIAFIPNPNNRLEIDHIDRNPANNKVENLRWVTRIENMRNTGLRSDNTSGEKNIHKLRGREKYTVEIYNKYIGNYDTLADAVVAREAFLRKKE